MNNNKISLNEKIIQSISNSLNPRSFQDEGDIELKVLWKGREYWCTKPNVLLSRIELIFKNKPEMESVEVSIPGGTTEQEKCLSIKVKRPNYGNTKVDALKLTSEQLKTMKIKAFILEQRQNRMIEEMDKYGNRSSPTYYAPSSMMVEVKFPEINSKGSYELHVQSEKNYELKAFVTEKGGLIEKMTPEVPSFSLLAPSPSLCVMYTGSSLTVASVAVNSHRYRRDQEITNIAFVISHHHLTEVERIKSRELLIDNLFLNVPYELRPLRFIRNSKKVDFYAKNKINCFSFEISKTSEVVQRMRFNRMISVNEALSLADSIEELEICQKYHEITEDSCNEKQKQMIENLVRPSVKIIVKDSPFFCYAVDLLDSLEKIDNLDYIIKKINFIDLMYTEYYKIENPSFQTFSENKEVLDALYILVRVYSGTARIEQELLTLGDSLPSLEVQNKIIQELMKSELEGLLSDQISSIKLEEDK